MNEKTRRLAEELAGLTADELEDVLQGVGIRARVRPEAKLLVPATEYSRHRPFLEAAGVGFEARGEPVGHLVLPPGSRVWSSPSILVPGGSSFVLAITSSTEGRRIVPL